MIKRSVTTMAMSGYLLSLCALILSSSSNNNYTCNVIAAGASLPNDNSDAEKVQIDQQQQEQQEEEDAATVEEDEEQELDNTVAETTSLIVIGILFVLTWIYLSFSNTGSKDRNKKQRKQELSDRSNKLLDQMSSTKRNIYQES